MRSLRTLFVALGSVALASPASAVVFDLDIFQGGNYQGTAGAAMLGCVDDVGGLPTAQCTGSGAQIGDLGLDMWDFFVDTDPVVSGVIGLTNLSGTTQQFTLLFTLPIAPPIPGATVIGGSIQGGATDNNGDGVTLAAPTGSSFYTALIDGASVQTLYDDPTSYSAGGFLSVNVPSLAYGTPIPSQAGPPALTSIAIRLDFTLTAGDSASFTSNFVVLPLPEPATGGLLALGFVGLAIARKARRA